MDEMKGHGKSMGSGMFRALEGGSLPEVTCGMTESNDEDCCEGRESALTVLRRTLAHYKRQLAAMEQMEKLLTVARIEDGSPLEEMLWALLQRSPIRRF